MKSNLGGEMKNGKRGKKNGTAAKKVRFFCAFAMIAKKSSSNTHTHTKKTIFPLFFPSNIFHYFNGAFSFYQAS